MVLIRSRKTLEKLSRLESSSPVELKTAETWHSQAYLFLGYRALTTGAMPKKCSSDRAAVNSSATERK